MPPFYYYKVFASLIALRIPKRVRDFGLPQPPGTLKRLRRGAGVYPDAHRDRTGETCEATVEIVRVQAFSLLDFSSVRA